MKASFKIAIVTIPVPTVFWVLKGSHPLWIKVTSSIWALFSFLMLIGATQTEGGFTAYAVFIFSSLIWFGIFHGLYSLFKKAISSAKNKKQTSKESNPTQTSKSEVMHSDDELNAPQSSSTSPQATTQESTDDALTQRRHKALYKLALQILEDNKVDLDESKKLRSWLRRYPESKNDRKTKQLYLTVESVLEDRVLDESESLEIHALLSDYCDAIDKVERAQEEVEKLKRLKQKPKSIFKASGSLGEKYAFLKQLRKGQEYFMEYKDYNGDLSTRNIVLHNANTNQQGQHYIRAHCLLRNSQRTFRVDRIESLCDVDTGEAFI